MRDYCNECLSIDSENIKAYIRRSLAYEGMGNFIESLQDISTVLTLKVNSSLTYEIFQIQNRVRNALKLDQKALQEEEVPQSYVTANQSMRLNFGATYDSNIIQNNQFKIKLNITNEFGLWNRMNLPPNSPEVLVEVEIVPLYTSQNNSIDSISRNNDVNSLYNSLKINVHSDRSFQSNGRVSKV